MGSSFLDLLLVQPYRTNKMNKFIGLAFSALVVCTSADKSFEQSQYSRGGAGAAGGFGGNAGGFGGAAGGFGGGDASYASDAAGGPGSLEEAIPGTPGEDYPIFSEVPETSFLCDGQADGGYYADPEAECQAFHICANDGNGGLTKYSFLCPNGTIFQQKYFVCDWWFNVDCSLAEELYSLNDDNAAERAANSGDAGQIDGDSTSGGSGGRNGGNQGGRGGSNGGGASGSGGRGRGGSGNAAGGKQGNAAGGKQGASGGQSSYGQSSGRGGSPSSSSGGRTSSGSRGSSGSGRGASSSRGSSAGGSTGSRESSSGGRKGG